MKLHLNSNQVILLPAECGQDLFPFAIQRGIGKQLMAVAWQEAKRMQKKIIGLVVIDTNINAIEFYKKIGFEIHSRTILDIPYFKEALKGM